ncbi:probable glycosyltransferase At3g07620 isoform X2 [Cynara cardunculus var. scolymus]|uniref:probable glycosyltransferase At3g07620 isoform X2 n=1 Tax=Cynara cardunculus var. scolymus TaxID=59895 RepID=UPI000D62C345|nr:probable glycosyltransferase At3g07620 isoform X2 [Cynara cardunculus var. scolymus]
MSQELQYLLETKRLVSLVAVVFALFMMFQYFEFPYGDVVSSLFSASKAQTLGNITRFDSSNYTKPAGILGKDNRTIYKGDDVGSGNFESERNADMDEFMETGDDVSREGVEEVEKAEVLAPEKATESGADFLIGNVSNSNSVQDIEEPGGSQKSSVPSDNKSSINEVPPVKGTHERPMGEVVTILEMHDMLVNNRASSHSMIENAPAIDNDHTLHPSLYVNISRFKRSYDLMEKILKVYIYKEGEKPIFHQPQAVLKGIYASEGWFMKHMKASKHFVTKKPKQAHLFYIPFSSRMLEEKLYVLDSHNHKNLVKYLKDYLDLIVGRYNFWNRTGGSDHFFVACHDWAASETKKHMDTCIRALCNSDVKKEGFKLGKDVALPETFVRSAKNPLREFGGKPPSQRSTLAFFAGQMHGNFRPILLQHWENKDPDMKIFGKLPKSKNNKNYVQYMKSSKYCICAKGYEVNSPRVVEAIFYECVPVIISDNFVPPFFEVLNWESFAVFVQEKEIANLKNILVSIPQKRYLVMQERVKQVQQHFLWHVKPVKYDIFHMILHSIWYNRVFRINPS